MWELPNKVILICKKWALTLLLSGQLFSFRFSEKHPQTSLLQFSHSLHKYSFSPYLPSQSLCLTQPKINTLWHYLPYLGIYWQHASGSRTFPYTLPQCKERNELTQTLFQQESDFLPWSRVDPNYRPLKNTTFVTYFYKRNELCLKQQQQEQPNSTEDS